MLIDLVDKLFSRLIELAKKREEADKNLFTDFVAPAFADFEAVHQDYINSFRKYRETIKDSNEFLNTHHTIFDVLKADSLFSGGQRAKLFELSEMQHEPIIGDFITAILKYIYKNDIIPQPRMERSVGLAGIGISVGDANNNSNYFRDFLGGAYHL